MSTSHTYHGPEEEHLVLKDNCPRCAEHAARPWHAVDPDRLDVLISKALAWEGDAWAGSLIGPESENERKACQAILDALDVVRALTGATDRRAVLDAVRRHETP